MEHLTYELAVAHVMDLRERAQRDRVVREVRGPRTGHRFTRRGREGG